MLNSMQFIETPEDLTRWVTSAKVGHRVAYYRGWLMKDKLRMMPFMVKNDMVMPEFKTAHKAWDFYTMGAVELFQKRLGDEDYLYIMVRK